MPKYNILATLEDKAGFIADNMELEYDGIDFDGVILFTSRLDKTVYGVTDYTGYSVFFELYYEAEGYLEALIETLYILKDDFDETETPILRLTKNHITFSEIIRGDDIDCCTLGGLFDDYVFDEQETITEVEVADSCRLDTLLNDDDFNEQEMTTNILL